MTENQAGVTALVTAYARAYHSTHEETPKIFDDFLAARLFTPQERAFLDQNLAQNLRTLDPALAEALPTQDEVLACAMQMMYEPVTLSRSRFCEDALEAAVRQGLSQYVILGAGFDTFAFRRPDLLPGLRVFELDHPVTQAMKRERIAQAGWQMPVGLALAPVDFTTQKLSEILPQAGYDPSAPAFFSWLGVTYYLTREAVTAALSELSVLAASGSQITFDYLENSAFIPGAGSQRSRLLYHIVRQSGEPMKTAFDPHALAAEFEALGWELAENLSPADVQSRYFDGRSDRLKAFENTRLARAVRR